MTLAISAAHGDLIVALRAGPRLVVIGAAAVDHHVKMRRGTADMDLAVVAELVEIAPLLGLHGWERDKKQWQRWRRGDDMIDVLPAAAHLVEAGFVRSDDGEREYSLVGFDLALAHATPVAIPGRTETVEVADIEALVVLKMVAWLDRPYERQRDLGDLAHIFENTLDDSDDRRWEPPLSDVDYEDQCAFFVGGAVGAIAREQHRLKIAEFLRRMGEGGWTGVMGKLGDLIADDPGKLAARRLSAFARGLG